MRKLSSCLLVIVGVFLLGEGAFAQSVSLESVTGLDLQGRIPVNQQVTFNLRVTASGTTNHGGITNGFRVYSPDGATWASTSGDTLVPGWDAWFDLVYSVNAYSADGMITDTIGFGGSRLFGSGLPSTFDEVAYSITIGPVDAAHHNKTIVLDSSFYGQTGVWKWLGATAAQTFFPAWDGPHSFTINNPNAPSNLVITPDSLFFSAIEGGSQPPAQPFVITSDNTALNFNLVENVSWIVPSPIVGTTARTINVSINTIGLTAGTYFDSIQVVAPSAGNSPQWVKIVLDLDPPPPTIDVTPSSVVFNAVAGGANPTPKTIDISNVGGGDLNWTVSSSETWLSLDPLSGTNSGTVTLEVDITGLPFGDYDDTVFVSDPTATNDPVPVPVHLSVASDLPLIDVDSSFNYIVVPGGVTSIPDRDIFVFNAGAGTMNFTLQENSPRILNLTPGTGAAPQIVTVGFKANAGTIGQNYSDTLWVESAEAINSPYPVVFYFHYVQNPATIVLNKDTVRLNVFECTQGANITPPSDYFAITNLGLGEAYSYQLLFESDYFTVFPIVGNAPGFIEVSPNFLDLPLGTYLDTILVSAVNAINSPETVIVKYQVNPASVAPEIYLSKDNYILPTQENEGPIPGEAFAIENRFGGCMDWEIQENVAWMSPSQITGTAPSGLTFNANAAGMVFGEYEDSLFVLSAGATNSPRKVTVRLRVWRFHGDVDYNNDINIADLLSMVDHQFNNGPGPQPEWRVGDLNCDHRVDISDMLYMVEYQFNFGPIPCGNPYK